MKNSGLGSLLGEYYDEISNWFSKYFANLMFIHVDENTLARCDGNPLFAEVTAKPYSLSDYRNYLISRIEEIVSEAGLKELLDTRVYMLIKGYFPQLKDITIRNIIYGYDFPTFSDPEYHKIGVITVATNLCFVKGNISFNKALNQVCTIEKEGIPAYKQEYENPNTDALVKKLKEVKDFIIANDDKITLEVLRSLIEG